MGLSGWRVFAIHKDNIERFEDISGLNQLSKQTAGQGIGWSDTQVLEDAGIAVQQTSKLQNLFRMAEKKRFDFLPLGAHGIFATFAGAENLAPNVVVEEKLLLIYPFARLFFVHKDNEVLHNIVRKGLLAAFYNGRFEQLFKSFPGHQALFDKVNLSARRQIRIENRHLTKKFRQIPSEFFFSLEQVR